jgi:hypothetical protein
MKREGSLPHSQKPDTCPYSELDRSSPCLHPTTWSILILSFHLRLSIPSGLFPSDFPTKTLYTDFLVLKPATFHAHPILDCFILVIVYMSVALSK